MVKYCPNDRNNITVILNGDTKKERFRVVIVHNHNCYYSNILEFTNVDEFTEEEIILTDHTFVTDYQYEDIEAITEKGNTVMIWFPNNYALRLYKDAFMEGSWEECKELLSRKMKK